MNLWFSEPVDSVNQWSKERMNHWTKEQWIHERTNQGTNELMRHNQTRANSLSQPVANLQSRSFATNRPRAASTVRTRPHKSGASLLHLMKSSSRYSLVHFLVTNEARNRGSRDPTSANPGVTYHQGNKKKKQNDWVSRPEVFSPVNSHASELLHFPTTWWWVVDMMMWLTCWIMMVCLPTTTSVGISEVLQLNFPW